MSYVEDHIAWLQSHGVKVLSVTDRTDVHGHPVKPIDTDLINGLPIDVREWFSARLFDRVDVGVVLGQPGAYLCRPGDELVGYDEYREVFDEWTQAGAFPIEPMSLFGVERLRLVLETVGDRAGWVYGLTYSGGMDPLGPVACSIPQYLEAVRGLVEVGLLSLSGHAEWMQNVFPVEARQGPGSPHPPHDTPGPMVEIPYPKFGDLNEDWHGEPLCESILDIVPGFELVSVDVEQVNFD